MPILAATLPERGIKFGVTQMYFDYGTPYYSFSQSISKNKCSKKRGNVA